MTVPAPHLDGGALTGRSGARHSSGRIWPLLIVALLAMNATIVAVTVYFASADKAVAVEPDYYAKALKFDDTIRRRDRSDQLGWSATPTLRAPRDAEGHRSMVLEVALTDREAHAIDGADLSVIAFASLRSAERQTLHLCATSTPGLYAAPMHVERAGLWRLRITATHAADTFYHEADLLLPDAATTASSPY